MRLPTSLTSCVRVYLDSRGFLAAVVDQHIVLDAIAMTREIRPALCAEEHTLRLAGAHRVARDQIVRVTMADGDADAIALDLIVERQAVFHAPAKEEPNVIAAHGIEPHDGALRAGPGMETETGVVFRDAMLHHHVMADLPADAIAVVVARINAANGDAIAVLEENAAPWLPSGFHCSSGFHQHQVLDATCSMNSPLEHGNSVAAVAPFSCRNSRGGRGRAKRVRAA